MARNKVIIWLCPKCGNFYGSTHAGDLQEKWNTDSKGNQTFRRSTCPDCRQRGEIVERKPLVF